MIEIIMKCKKSKKSDQAKNVWKAIAERDAPKDIPLSVIASQIAALVKP